MTYFVYRSSKMNPTGVSYVGPLSANRAAREADAWKTAGEWVEIIEATPETKKHVRRWEKVSKTEDARDSVTFRGETMTMAAYRLSYES